MNRVGVFREGTVRDAASCRTAADVRNCIDDKGRHWNTDAQALELGYQLDIAEVVAVKRWPQESQGAHSRWVSQRDDVN